MSEQTSALMGDMAPWTSPTVRAFVAELEALCVRYNVRLNADYSANLIVEDRPDGGPVLNVSYLEDSTAEGERLLHSWEPPA